MEADKIEMSGTEDASPNIPTPEECVSGDYELAVEKEPKRVLTGFSAMMIVVASMVGTGVFTTSGLLFDVLDHSASSIWTILIAWLIGGVAAFFGAISYAELVAMYPRNGGEYQILSKVFHPAIGFVAGWISLIVGFSAPIASTAIVFSEYVGQTVQISDTQIDYKFWLAFVVIVLLSIIHGVKVTFGSAVQNFLTVIKVLLVTGFIAGGIYLGDFSHLANHSASQTASQILTPGFATGLILVTYAYTGWNGSVYIAGEIKNPSRALPKALALGTALVTLIYLALNTVFLISAPISELHAALKNGGENGNTVIGAIAAKALFGDGIGNAFSLVIAFLLLSSLSAMIMAGPRIYQSMGEDYRAFRFLTHRKGNSGPFWAIALQAVIAIIMLMTARFDELITYMGFTLSVSTALTVVGVFVMRRKRPNMIRPYKCWGYPFTPIIFIILSLWMVIFTFMERPSVAFVGAATILIGMLLYFIVKPFNKNAKSAPTDSPD